MKVRMMEERQQLGANIEGSSFHPSTGGTRRGGAQQGSPLWHADVDSYRPVSLVALAGALSSPLELPDDRRQRLVHRTRDAVAFAETGDGAPLTVEM